MGDLQKQREWIKRHVRVLAPKTMTSGSHKHRTYSYYLPNPTQENDKVLVCKKMFLNTVGTSERMVRTTLAKTMPVTSILEGELRGGRSEKMKQNDASMRQEINNHISRFPHMEFYYCRQSTTYQYLSPELNISKMHRVFKDEHPDSTVSLSLYRKVFKIRKLKFHSPKKDQCGLCGSYRNGSPELKERLKEKYDKHIAEKEKVREIKQMSKEKSQQNKKTRDSII